MAVVGAPTEVCRSSGFQASASARPLHGLAARADSGMLLRNGGSPHQPAPRTSPSGLSAEAARIFRRWGSAGRALNGAAGNNTGGGRCGAVFAVGAVGAPSWAAEARGLGEAVLVGGRGEAALFGGHGDAGLLGGRGEAALFGGRGEAGLPRLAAAGELAGAAECAGCLEAALEETAASK